MSVPGCWTRRTGPLLMSGETLPRRRRRDSRPFSPARPTTPPRRGPRRTPSAIASTNPSRSPAPERLGAVAPRLRRRLGSGTSRSSGGGDLQRRRAERRAGDPVQRPRRHRRRRRPRRPSGHSRSTGAARRPSGTPGHQRAVLVDDHLDDPVWVATSSFGPAGPLDPARRPALERVRRRRPGGPRAAGHPGRPLAPGTPPEVDQPRGDERAARRGGRPARGRGRPCRSTRCGTRRWSWPRHRDGRRRASSTSGTPWLARGARSTRASARATPRAG